MLISVNFLLTPTSSNTVKEVLICLLPYFEPTHFSYIKTQSKGRLAASIVCRPGGPVIDRVNAADMTWLSYPLFASAATYLRQLSCFYLSCPVFASSATFLLQLPFHCINCHIFAQLPCTCLKCHVFSSPAMNFPQLPSLPFICPSCHLFGYAAMFSPQLTCIRISCQCICFTFHVFVANSMYLPQLPCN